MMIDGVNLCFWACLIKINLVSCAQAPWCAQASWCAHAPWCVQAPWYRWGDLWALDGVQLVVHQPQPDGDVHLRVASLLHQHHQLGMGWSSIFDPLSSIFDHRSSIFDHRSSIIDQGLHSFSVLITSIFFEPWALLGREHWGSRSQNQQSSNAYHSLSSILPTNFISVMYLPWSTLMPMRKEYEYH